MFRAKDLRPLLGSNAVFGGPDKLTLYGEVIDRALNAAKQQRGPDPDTELTDLDQQRLATIIGAGSFLLESLRAAELERVPEPDVPKRPSLSDAEAELVTATSKARTAIDAWRASQSEVVAWLAKRNDMELTLVDEGFADVSLDKLGGNESPYTMFQMSKEFRAAAANGDTYIFMPSLDKNGKELSAFTSVNDLMILLDIDELTSKPGKVKIYDFDLKQDVDQRKMVFSELLNQQIGIIFEMRDNTWNGKTTSRPEFAGFYDAETRQSSAEKLGESEAVAWQRNLDYLTGDAHIIKQAVNQPSSPQNSAPLDPTAGFNDDIPF
jgi:hypothetical protein